MSTLSIAEDLSVIAAAARDGMVNIFKRVSGSYMLNQSLLIGFLILEVVITNE